VLCPTVSETAQTRSRATSGGVRAVWFVVLLTRILRSVKAATVLNS